jgi:capsular exopolysaccharide synthesis family protein
VPAVVGQIRCARVQLASNSPILPFDGVHSRAAEQYKIIRTKILQHPLQPRMIMVSSPMPGDGKTVTAINLAGALALHEGLNVVLVDADFRRSSMTPALGFEQSAGVGEVLRGAASLQDVLVRVEQFPNLYVLPAGDASPNPAELMTSSRWKALCESLRRQFRFAVFDAPPVATVADYDLLQEAVDGVVLIIRPDRTDRGLSRQALETIPKDKQLGVILNCAEDWFLWKTHSYYYYGSNSRSE